MNKNDRNHSGSDDETSVDNQTFNLTVTVPCKTDEEKNSLYALVRDISGDTLKAFVSFVTALRSMHNKEPIQKITRLSIRTLKLFTQFGLNGLLLTRYMISKAEEMLPEEKEEEKEEENIEPERPTSSVNLPKQNLGLLEKELRK